MIYNLGLLFDNEEFNKLLVDYSWELANAYPGGSDYQLDHHSSFPHCTILQFNAESKNVKQIWNRVEFLRKYDCKFNFHGMRLERVGNRDWISLNVIKNKVLTQVQNLAMQYLKCTGPAGQSQSNPKSLVKKILNHTKTKYDPHITVGAYVHNFENVNFPCNSNILNQLGNLKTYLCLGESDLMFQFTKKLYL